MLIVYFSIFLFLIISKKYRFWFKRKELYIALFIVYLAMFLPTIHNISDRIIPVEKILLQNKIKKTEYCISNTKKNDIVENFRTTKNLKQKFIKFDHIIFKFINSSLKSNFLDFYISLPSYCDFKGFNIFFFVTLIVSIVILWNNKRKHFLVALTILVNIFTVGTIVTYFLKQYFERPRPLSILGYENVNTLFEIIYVKSFPSGHAESTAAICTFMFIMVRKYWYWYIIFVICTGFYRVYVGSHFPSDVLVGILIGNISAYMVVNLFKKYSNLA